MINERDLDVLNILWESEEPMLVVDIVARKKGLTQSTVTAVLRKLLKEELVEVTGVTHSGRALGRVYRPTERSREVLLADFLELYNRFSSVISEAEICAKILCGSKNEDKIKAEYRRLMELTEMSEIFEGFTERNK